MIILDKPYVSKELTEYLFENKIPVLENSLSKSFPQLNLCSEEKFSSMYQDGTRLFTLSENSLDWINTNIKDEKLKSYIKSMKDKVSFREKISSIYPDFFFANIPLEELESYEIDESKLPLVLKPTVGFFSVGVYNILTKKDYQQAVCEILSQHKTWCDQFPDSVVGSENFILEQYIKGEEYAMDAYFDDNGNAVVVNVMHHRFSSAKDVSDRLYYTSGEIIKKFAVKFTDYLNKINSIFNMKNFPVHVEVRVNEKEEIVPIEFNPMRFAGWCTTDLTYFAYGFRTYDYYFRNQKPNWDEILKEKEDKVYSLIVLDKPQSYSGEDFDFQKLRDDFSKVLNIRKLNYKNGEPFAFLFTETTKEEDYQLEKIMKSDLTEYLI